MLFALALMAQNAACAWNDSLDVEYDCKVTRCSLRPIARGAISVRNEYIYSTTLFAIWLSIMWTLPPQHMKYTVLYIVCNVAYPLSKRITYYTPACIGFTIAIGVFMGSTVLDIDLVKLWATGSKHSATTMACLYTTTGTWTIVYEGTYSFQDFTDDLKAGVMSLAVGNHQHAKQFLSMFASLQVILLIATGLLMDAEPLYYARVCGGTAVSLTWMLWSVDLTLPEECWW